MALKLREMVIIPLLRRASLKCLSSVQGFGQFVGFRVSSSKSLQSTSRSAIGQCDVETGPAHRRVGHSSIPFHSIQSDQFKSKSFRHGPCGHLDAWSNARPPVSSRSGLATSIICTIAIMEENGNHRHSTRPRQPNSRLMKWSQFVEIAVGPKLAGQIALSVNLWSR